MQVKQILKTTEKGQAYYKYTLQSEIYTLRFIGSIGAAFTAIFLVIDQNRANHLYELTLLRSIELLLFLLLAILAFKIKFNLTALHFVCYFLSSCLYLITFLIDFYAGMPIFFLTNSLCLFLFVFNASLGHPLKFKVTQTILLYLIYLYYSLELSPHSSIHTPQSINIFLNCSLSLLIGLLIERYKLFSFRQQDLLIESQKKNEELSSLKSRLISVLSHDLAAPINNLSALIQLKESNVISASELDGLSKKIKDSLLNLSIMMQNLLKWSKSQLEGFRPRKEKINLPKLVKEVIASLEFAASQKEITVLNEVVNFDNLHSDSEVLKMAVRNFLTNAIKFSNLGDSIVISSRQEESSIALSVKDNGIGMSEKQLEKLFSFNKKSVPGTNNEKGTGLGLVITKDFVDMIGGTISAKSEVGKGAEFIVTLPTTNNFSV